MVLGVRQHAGDHPALFGHAHAAVGAKFFDPVHDPRIGIRRASGKRRRDGIDRQIATQGQGVDPAPVRAGVIGFSTADLDEARKFVGAADRILYDAKTPPGAALPGGMGLRFDWALLDGFRHPLPWALSGGLDAANVGEAIARTGATLVDVSSGVESAPGVKDMDKIGAFLKATQS